MKEFIFPYAPLLYWSKSWISFSQTHPEWNTIDCAKEILRMCNYPPGQHIELQYINMMEHLVVFLQKYNEAVDKSKKITIPAIMTSIYAFESEVAHYADCYDLSKEEAIIMVIKSQLSWMPIKGVDFKIEPIKYDRKCSFTMGGDWSKPGVTYTFMQKRFNKGWEDVLTEIPPIKKKQSLTT